MCASPSQPPETQGRLRRVWGSQEGPEKHAQHTCREPSFFDHLTACSGDLSTLFTSVDFNIALFHFLIFPASMATDLLRCLVTPTAEAVTESWRNATECQPTCWANPSLEKPDETLELLCTSPPARQRSHRCCQGFLGVRLPSPLPGPTTCIAAPGPPPHLCPSGHCLAHHCPHLPRFAQMESAPPVPHSLSSGCGDSRECCGKEQEPI